MQFTKHALTQAERNTEDNQDAVKELMGAKYNLNDDGTINIKNEWCQVVEVGEWIVQDGDSFYPVSNDYFIRHYKPLIDPSSELEKLQSELKILEKNLLKHQLFLESVMGNDYKNIDPRDLYYLGIQVTSMRNYKDALQNRIYGLMDKEVDK